METYVLKEAVRRRWELIEFCLNWEGAVGRKRLQDAFNISPQQATNDLNGYADLARGNMHYDPRKKSYIRSETFSEVLTSGDPHDYLDRLNSGIDGRTQDDAWISFSYSVSGIVPRRRKISSDVLREITKGIREQRVVKGDYISLSDEAPFEEKEFVPLALASDGHRWHARVYNVLKDRFSDYVLSRFRSASAEQSYVHEMKRDDDWFDTVDIRLGPNPTLDAARRNALEFEYEMQEGQVEITVKKAMLFYYLRHFGFNPFAQRGRRMSNESSFNLVIINFDEIEHALGRR
ncbi:MAG: WYL domain-containing protein [Pseudomonadota bacterium]